MKEVKEVRLRQVYRDVHMGLYRGVDSLKVYLEQKKMKWGEGDLFLFRNSAMTILIAFAPAFDGFAYRRLNNTKRRFDFSVLGRDDILTMFAEALGMRWVSDKNVFELIAREDANRKKEEGKR